jgi:alpha-L-fucosidase
VTNAGEVRTVVASAFSDRALPEWFDDAKFGIFIHWGLYSIPGWAPLSKAEDERIATFTEPYYEADRISTFAEDYARSMSVADSPTARYHAERFGDLPYDAFADRFRAHLAGWDPDAWAELFEQAGARYVVLTTKTEDGFLLWPSDRPNPSKERWQVDRDVVGELAAAVRARGMEFGTYYSGKDWAFEDEPGRSRPYGSLAHSRAWVEQVLAHWDELVDRYQTAVMWADLNVPGSALEDWDPLFRRYYERVPQGVVNDRLGSDRETAALVRRDFDTFESVLQRGGDYTNAPRERKWESCRGMGPSWAFNRREREDQYPTSAQLIQELIDVVARGGNLLLNVGPTGEGTIRWDQATRLLDIGWWLRRYGSAIYGTRRWGRPTGSTPDGLEVRFTASPDAVHAIVLGTPVEGGPGHPQATIDVHLDDRAQVALEDRREPLEWRRTDRGIAIDLPDQPDEQPAIAFRLSPKDAIHAA